MEQQLKNIEQHPTHFSHDFKQLIKETPNLEEQLIKINNTSDHNYNPWDEWMSSTAFKVVFSTNDSVIGDIKWTDSMVTTIMSHAGIWEGSISDNTSVSTFICKTGGMDVLKRWVDKETAVLPALAYCRCRIDDFDEDGMYPTILFHAAKQCGIKPTTEITELVKSWFMDFETEIVSETDSYPSVDLKPFYLDKLPLKDGTFIDKKYCSSIWVAILDLFYGNVNLDICDLNVFNDFIRNHTVK